MNRTIGLVTANYDLPQLGELTEKRSPASVPFGGLYRLMDFAMSNLVNAHIPTVGLVTPYYSRSILDHVRAGKAWGLDRKEGGLFILPGTVFGPQKQGGRLLFRDIVHNRSYLERGDGDYILVTSGSIVMNIDYRPIIDQHELLGRPVTMIYKNLKEGENPNGCYLSINEKGLVTDISSEPVSRSYLLESYIIDKSLLLQLVKDYSALGNQDLLDVLRVILPDYAFGSYEFTGYVGIIQNLQDYMRTSSDLLCPEIRRELFSRERPIATQVHDTPPARYVPGAEVCRSVVAAGSIIEGTVENSIVSRNVRIEKGAVVKDCVLMDGCIVRSGACLENVIADKKCEITSGTVFRGTAEHPIVLPRAQVI